MLSTEVAAYVLRALINAQPHSLTTAGRAPRPHQSQIEVCGSRSVSSGFPWMSKTF